MGTGETGTPTKSAKLTVGQDQQTSYPEWAAAFQAYYNSGGQPPHGYFPPSVASGPQPHPYMWGAQPIMQPYGTPPPPPYGAIYTHRGVYGHPAMPQGSHAYAQFGLLSPGVAGDGTTATLGGGEGDGCKMTDSAKDRSPMQRSKGSLGNVGLQGSKGSDTGKGNSGSGNGVFSQSSGESASEGSSEGSEEDNSQNLLQKQSFEQMTLDGGGPNSNVAVGPHGGGVFLSSRGNMAGVQPGTIAQIGGPSKMSSGSSLTTNLGIGVKDYWSGSTRRSQGGKRSCISTSSGIMPTTPATPLVGPVGREGVPPELWLQPAWLKLLTRRAVQYREAGAHYKLVAEFHDLLGHFSALDTHNVFITSFVVLLSLKM